jgi:hypothetical protein
MAVNDKSDEGVWVETVVIYFNQLIAKPSGYTIIITKLFHKRLRTHTPQISVVKI